MGKKRLISLRTEKQKLLKLVQKQAIAIHDAKKAKEEEEKLNKEIKKLKLIAGGNFKKKSRVLSKLFNKARSPETKEKLKKAGKQLKSGFKEFQKFAAKYG